MRVLCGVENSRISKRFFPVSIDFGEASDVYFVSIDSIAGIFQSMLSSLNFEAVNVLKWYTGIRICFNCYNIISEG